MWLSEQDLALENLNLAPESQHLSLQLGLVAVSGRDHIQYDAYQRRPYHPGANSYAADVTTRLRHCRIGSRTSST